MEVMILVFQAPLMSFGGVLVDAHGPTDDFPGLCLITGLAANALGYQHREHERLGRLQERLRLASRCDQPGTRMQDFHTVDLGDRAGPHEVVAGQPYQVKSTRPHLAHGGWTTRGRAEHREGKPDARFGTHIRARHYHADRIQVVALSLEPAEETPTLTDLCAAFAQPARPLFLGRKTCLPSRPLLAGTLEAASLREALARWPRHPRSPTDTPLPAWWPARESTPEETPEREWAVVDCRDWRNQLVTGRRLVHQGRVTPPPPPESAEIAP